MTPEQRLREAQRFALWMSGAVLVMWAVCVLLLLAWWALG